MGEQPRPVPTPGVPAGEFQPLWIRAWLLLFTHWARAHGRRAVALVRDYYGFVGELAEAQMPEVVSRVTGLLTIARQQQRDVYEVEPGSPVIGLVATPEGAGFIWRGPPTSERGFSWYTNTMEAAARTLWPREPHGRFFNMTNGKKIEREFWQAAPQLGADAQAAVQRIVGCRGGTNTGLDYDDDDDVPLTVR